MTDDQRATYLALVIGVFATLEAATRPFTIFFVLIAPLVLLGYRATGRVSVVAAYLIGGGLINRLDQFPPGGWTDGSESLRVVSEATATMLAGQNPYDHAYVLSVHPYTFTVHSPPMLLLHAPGQFLLGLSGAMLTQIAAAAVVMAVLLWLGARFGWTLGLPVLAAYSCLPFLIELTINGTNDTAVGAAVLVGAVVLWRAMDRPTTGALIVAGTTMALTFGAKQFAWPVALVLVIHTAREIGWRKASIVGAAAAIVWLAVALPFIAMNPSRFFGAIVNDLVSSAQVWGWNIWNAMEVSGLPAPTSTLVITLGATLGTLVVACLVRYRTYGEAVLGGIAVPLVLLLTTRWTSASYLPLFAALALAAPLLMREAVVAQPVQAEAP